MTKRTFSQTELVAAMDKVAKGDVPSWMDATEKQAYALGVIGKEHIIDHARCHGRGWMPSCNPYADAACNCPGSTGKVLSDEGKALIKVSFPEYKMRFLEN